MARTLPSSRLNPFKELNDGRAEVRATAIGVATGDGTGGFTADEVAAAKRALIKGQK